MFKTGDIVHFYNEFAIPKPKDKYSLCVGVGDYFLFLSSPKYRVYDATISISLNCCSGLPNNDEQVTIVSITNPFQISDEELIRCNAKYVGKMNNIGLMQIANFALTCETLTEDQREAILTALGDFI